MRTPPASSRSSAAAMLATESPRLPPRPSRTSGTAAPFDDDAHMVEDGVDGGGGLADLDHNAIDRREGRQDGRSHCLSGGLDEVEALRRHGFEDELRERVVADRLLVIVAAPRGAEVEEGGHVEGEALAELVLLGQHAMAREDLKTLEHDAVAHTDALRSASRTRIACTCSFTSCTRTMSAPAMTPNVFAATVPGKRAVSGTSGWKRRPIKAFRDSPSSTGKPRAFRHGS